MIAGKIDINEIMSIIPHRYPVLLIDKVMELDLNKSIVGIKNVTMNEPQFTGHFPHNPVMPGVLIIEAMAQLSAILVAKSLDSFDDKEVLLVSVENSKFRKVVVPGDSMLMHAELLQNRGNVWKFKGHAKVDGSIVAESVFTAMVKESKKI